MTIGKMLHKLEYLREQQIWLLSNYQIDELSFISLIVVKFVQVSVILRNDFV